MTILIHPSLFLLLNVANKRYKFIYKYIFKYKYIVLYLLVQTVPNFKSTQVDKGFGSFLLKKEKSTMETRVDWYSKK